MKYNCHAGHNAAGRVACGSVSFLNESTENRLINNEVIRLLKADKHTVYNCTVNDAPSVRDNLIQIVKKCNKHEVDYDFSFHFNSAANDKKGNGKTTGSEAWISESGGSKDKKKAVAKRVLKNLEELGFKNRGVKETDDLYVINHTYAKCILFEVCFVDDKDDYLLYKKLGYKKIARAIAEGIVGHKIRDKRKGTVVATKKFKTIYSMNIREKASTESKIVGSYKNGTVVSGVVKPNDWLLTDKGYVRIKGTKTTYLKEVK